MSRHREEFDLSLSLVDAMTACREAITALDWRVMQQGGTGLACKEVTPHGMSFTWAAQVEILLTSKSSDTTRVTLHGSIFGFGPIQSGHLRGQVGNLRNRIELAGAKGTKPAGRRTTSTPLVSELEKLVGLHSQGILSDEEYHRAKARLLSKQSDSGRSDLN